MASDAEVEAGWAAYVRCQGGWRESFIAALEAAEAVRGRDAVDAESRGYAAAREQAALLIETAMHRNLYEWQKMPIADAIRKMEPNT